MQTHQRDLERRVFSAPGPISGKPQRYLIKREGCDCGEPGCRLNNRIFLYEEVTDEDGRPFWSALSDTRVGNDGVLSILFELACEVPSAG